MAEIPLRAFYWSQLAKCSHKSKGLEMRKIIGYIGSHALYFFADCVDLVMDKMGSRRLFPLYRKLLVRSVNVENWGGGGGAWGSLWEKH